MSVLAELLGIEEPKEPEKNLVLLRTRDGFEKTIAVEAHVADYGEIKVPFMLSDRALHAGTSSPWENVTVVARSFYRTSIKERGAQVWEER